MAEAASATTSRLRRTMLLGPALTVIGVFMILPMVIVLVYSFLVPGTFGGVVWEFSTDSYVQFLFERDIFDDTLTFNSAYLNIYSRSFLQALFATVAGLIIGFPTAYYIATRPESSRNLWLFLITIPYWINLLIRTISMLLVLRDEGPLNNLLIASGVIDTPLTLAYTNFAVGLGLVYSYLPFMVLPIYASIEKLDFSLVEAAYDLYADRLAVLRRVIIPLSLPGIAAGSLLVFIPSLGTFLAPDILGGGKNLMIGNMIALQFQSSRNWPFGSVAALILLSVVLVTLILYAKSAGRKVARAGH